MSGRVWCVNSGTYASFDERTDGPDTDHVKCSQCGRVLKLRRDAVIPHHRPAPTSEPR